MYLLYTFVVDSSAVLQKYQSNEGKQNWQTFYKYVLRVHSAVAVGEVEVSIFSCITSNN